MSNKFTVSSLCESKEYRRYKDILLAIYGPDAKVTKKEATTAIDEHLKRSVK